MSRFYKCVLGNEPFNRLVTFPLFLPRGRATVGLLSRVCSPCRLKVEELEGERSRLEEEKKVLETQLERLTLQVSSSGACPALLFSPGFCPRFLHPSHPTF